MEGKWMGGSGGGGMERRDGGGRKWWKGGGLMGTDRGGGSGAGSHCHSSCCCPVSSCCCPVSSCCCPVLLCCCPVLSWHCPVLSHCCPVLLHLSRYILVMCPCHRLIFVTLSSCGLFVVWWLVVGISGVWSWSCLCGHPFMFTVGVCPHLWAVIFIIWVVMGCCWCCMSLCWLLWCFSVQLSLIAAFCIDAVMAAAIEKFVLLPWMNEFFFIHYGNYLIQNNLFHFIHSQWLFHSK